MGYTDKIRYTFRLVWYYLQTIIIRIYRLTKSPFAFIKNLFRFRFSWNIILQDLLSFILLFIDIFAGPEIIMILFLWSKSSVRMLENKEKLILREIIGDLIDSDLILINTNANFLTNNGRYAFVSFFFIHTDNVMSDRTFAHELIHIWQYTRFGSAYIIKALFAQKSKEGYDYKGAKHLMNTYSFKKGIMEYNFEQQGEILADYFMLLRKKDEFSKHIFEHNHRVYKYFIDDIRSIGIYRL